MDTPGRERDVLRVFSTDAAEMVLPIAGLGSRSYAFLIDWHFRVVLAAAWSALAFGVAYLVSESGVVAAAADEDAGLAAMWLIAFPAGAIYLLYHPVLELFMHGRTPGKRIARVRIVTTAGTTPGAGPILIRNAFRLIDSLPVFYIVGLAVGMFTRHQVRIGDLAAGTLLVHEDRPGPGTFDTVAGRVDAGADLRLAELVDDLLARWSSLSPDRRRSLATGILAPRGVTPDATLRGRKLDAWLREQLGRVRDAAR